MQSTEKPRDINKQMMIVHWLNKYQAALRTEEYCEEEIIRLRARAQKISNSLSFAPGGGGEPSTTDKSLVGIEAAEERLVNAIDNSIKIRLEVEEVVNIVPAQNQSDVLRSIYIEGLDQKQTARKMNYSTKQIGRIHTAAIDWLEKMSKNVPYICDIIVV